MADQPARSEFTVRAVVGLELDQFAPLQGTVGVDARMTASFTDAYPSEIEFHLTQDWLTSEQLGYIDRLRGLLKP